MYSILFHLLWLSLLEIIFYFEYIGPLETKTYLSTIKRLINNKKNNENNYLIDPYNTSNIINLNDIEYNTDKAKKDREKYNYDLYMKTINYWLILLSVILCFYIFIVIYKYREFKKKKEEMRINQSEIEFTTVRNRTFTSDTEELSIRNRSFTSDTDELSEINGSYLKYDEKFINWFKVKRLFLKKSIFYISLGILILGFEYLFFNYIIIKYKVLSDDEIINEIYKLINPLLENVFNY